MMMKCQSLRHCWDDERGGERLEPKGLSGECEWQSEESRSERAFD